MHPELRVLFFNYEFPPIGGGGANANAYLFREFARIPELTIDCITSTMNARDEVVPFAPNITLHRLAVGKRDLHFWTQREVLTWLRRAHFKAGELLARHNYDLSHAFFGFPSGMASWLRRWKLPYLVSLRGTDVPGFNPRFAAQYVLLRPLFRRIWKDGRFVVANSVGLRTLARRLTPEMDIPVIPNGIDTEEFSPPAAGERQPEHILCVSRLVGRKGVQHLIEAMPQIVSSLPDALLTLVGEGNLAGALRQRVDELGMSGRVRFLGYVPHDQLPAIYRSARLYVQPSFYEGMSNTVLEAMACGLPVVATGEGGREELFRGNARLIEHGNPGALADTINNLFRDGDELDNMGRTSREIALDFSWQAVAEQYLDLYRETHASGHNATSTQG